MSRRRGIFLSFVIICIIGAITVHITNEPKNVFEEMYAAEMYAARWRKKTPLSGTEYFKEREAETERQDENFTTVTVKEVSKEHSPYTLEAEYLRHKEFGHISWSALDINHNLIQKILKIESRVTYQNVDINIQYRYILSTEGDFETFLEFEREKGLYIYVMSPIDGMKITGNKGFSVYDIPKSGLREKIEQDLNDILNYWVDNYADTKFKHDDFGAYEIVKFS